MITPSWQDTFLALHSANTVHELWALLVTPHGIKSSTAWDEAFILFRRFHAHDPNDAAPTALLLCTDHRWRKAAHRLIHRLADSDLLNTQDLNLLTVSFVHHEVTVTTNSHGDVRRSVWPPLRRWAAARTVTNDGTAWQPLLDRARTEPIGHGAAVAAGVMDAAAAIPPDERMRAIEEGLNWGSGIVHYGTAIHNAASLPSQPSPTSPAKTPHSSEPRTTRTTKSVDGHQTPPIQLRSQRTAPPGHLPRVQPGLSNNPCSTPQKRKRPDSNSRKDRAEHRPNRAGTVADSVSDR